jgi:histidinol-phosphate aminotransferase
VALRHADEMLARVDELRATRDELLRRGPEMGFDVSTRTPTSSWSAAGPTGTPPGSSCWTRASSSGRPDPTGFLRVSAGTPEEMEAFYDAPWRVDAARKGE